MTLDATGRFGVLNLTTTQQELFTKPNIKKAIKELKDKACLCNRLGFECTHCKNIDDIFGKELSEIKSKTNKNG